VSDDASEAAGAGDPGDFLQQVYDLTTQDDTDAYYSRWAASYDEELTRQGYRTPRRCADALRGFVAFDAPVLDIGCGTGLSGRAFADVGFTDLTGTDVNAEMLAIAETAQVYRHTRVTDVDDPFPFVPGTYAAIAAVGVIGVGAAPAPLLPRTLAALAPGGHLVFSYNDHALEVAEYRHALDQSITTGVAEQVFAERGPHIEGLGSSATVYVLRRI
jgi:predicted TPR repeat methyltransferase